MTPEPWTSKRRLPLLASGIFILRLSLPFTGFFALNRFHFREDLLGGNHRLVLGILRQVCCRESTAHLGVNALQAFAFLDADDADAFDLSLGHDPAPEDA